MASQDSKSFKYILNIIWKCLLGFLALLIISYISIGFIAPRKVISIFRFQNFVISSNSMDPTIKYGDIIIVKQVNIEDLKVGDIVTFYVDFNLDGKDEVVTHYLAEINTNEDNKYFFRTHRENTTIYDSWLIEEEDIIGRYVTKIKSIGKISLYIQSGFGLGIFIVDIIIIIFISMILSSLNDDKNKHDDIVGSWAKKKQTVFHKIRNSIIEESDKK